MLHINWLQSMLGFFFENIIEYSKMTKSIIQANKGDTKMVHCQGEFGGHTS